VLEGYFVYRHLLFGHRGAGALPPAFASLDTYGGGGEFEFKLLHIWR
jgi:hypothetical protein